MTEEGDLIIEGTRYDSNDLTFGEEREVRALVREMVGQDDPDFDALPLGDVLPALCAVLRKRDDPEYKLEDALKLKQRDVLVGDEDTGPPTQPGGSSSKPTRARSGSRK
jgi:hypothetical protein